MVSPIVPPICWKNVRLAVALPTTARLDAVLDERREQRERRPDAEAGDDHPDPQDRQLRVGAQVGQQEQPDREDDHRTRG